MATITSLGIGSGLELNKLLDQMTTAEKASLDPITRQQSAFTAKLTAYGSLKSALSAFQTANTALSSADLFSATSASSTGNAFSATTGANAVAGKYTISVSQLAQSQTLTSGVKSDSKTAIATADSTLTIQQGNGKAPVSIAISAANSSLSGIRDAINQANAGVSASIIKVDDGSYRLSLSTSATGEKNAMTLGVSGDSALSTFLTYNGTNTDDTQGMIQTVPAKDAELKVNNIDIKSATNNISDAIEGITLNLTDVTSSNQTLTVKKDDSKATEAINNWVKAYNALQDTFSSLTKYTSVETGSTNQDKTNGALLGDSTLRTIQTQLKTMLTNAASSSTFKTLAQVGVTSDPNSGKLVVDNNKLASALSSDAAGVKEMITGNGKTTGITTTIGSNLTSWLSGTGILQHATDGVSKTLNRLTEQYNTASARIDDTIARYKTQFAQLDVMMSKLNNTSSYLTQQFESLSESKK